MTVLMVSALSCNPDLNPPPVLTGPVKDCQIDNIFLYNAVEGKEGFPELFTSPMQGWNLGVSVWAYNSDNNPAILHGAAQTIWDNATIDYNTDQTVNKITQYAISGNGSGGPICQGDTCQKIFLFNYDANGNPGKITGERRDYNGNLISSFPVCDNEFDTDHRLILQKYPDQSYWRFEYNTQGNLFRMYHQGFKESAELLIYEFKSYDDKTNFAKTNPFWQLYFNTYSNNNPLSYRHYTGKIQLPTGGFINGFVDVKEKYNYGANFGRLPTAAEFDNADTGIPFFENYPLNYISYQCKSIITPGN